MGIISSALHFFDIMKSMNDKSYIIIEQINSTFRKSEISFENNNETLRVKSIKEFDNYDDFKKPKIKEDRVIIALSSENSSTIESTIEIERDNKDSNISKKELDKLIYKSLWEFLNKYRSWSFKKMGITDLDMVLANIRVINVFLDDRKVFNPIGFQGKKLRIELQGTFVPRNILPIIEYFSDFGKEAKVIERFTISSLYGAESSCAVLNMDRKNSYSYEIKEKEAKYLKNHKIGINDFINVISNSIKIKEWEAEEILKRYFNDNLSKKMNSFVEEITKPLVDKVKSITKELSKKRDVFINIPKLLYLEVFDRDSNIKRIDFKKILESHEFNVIISEENKSLFDEYSFLALVDYPIFSDHYKKLNNLLKRRSKWLVPNDNQ